SRLRWESAGKWKHVSVSTGSQSANSDRASAFKCFREMRLRESRGSHNATSGVVSSKIIELSDGACAKWPLSLDVDREHCIPVEADLPDQGIVRKAPAACFRCPGVYVAS